MKSLILVLLALSSYDHTCKKVDGAFTFGNLNVILNVPNGLSTVENPHKAKFNNVLWCQAYEDKNTTLPIESVLYRHFETNQTFDATSTPAVERDEERAILNFTNVPLADILTGKYVCHINSTNDTEIHGNQFVYVRPFFHFGGQEVKLSDDDSFKVIGSSVETTKGETVKFSCPAAGGPNLTVTWEKDDGKTLPEKHQKVGNDLIIPNVDSSDEGEYRCIATATVKNETKSPEYELEAVLTHYLKKVEVSVFDEGSGLSDDVPAATDDASYKQLSETEA